MPPQHSANPVLCRTHVRWNPATTLVTSLTPGTFVGVELGEVDPRPSCAELFAPQHQTSYAAVTAHTLVSEADT